MMKKTLAYILAAVFLLAGIGYYPVLAASEDTYDVATVANIMD